MNMNGRQQESQKRKNKSGGIWWVLVLAIGFLLNLTDSDIPFDAVAPIIKIVIFIAVIAVAVIAVMVKIGKHAANGKRNGERKPEAERHSFSVSGRPKAYERPEANHMPDAEQRKYYDEKTIFQNQERDSDRRLRQLDDFLKNGIIDREEYKILRSRYERGL